MLHADVPSMLIRVRGGVSDLGLGLGLGLGLWIFIYTSLAYLGHPHEASTHFFSRSFGSRQWQATGSYGRTPLNQPFGDWWRQSSKNDPSRHLVGTLMSHWRPLLFSTYYTGWNKIINPVLTFSYWQTMVDMTSSTILNSHVIHWKT